MGTVLAAELRVECQGIIGVVDIWIVQFVPRHPEDDGMRQGHGVEGDKFFVASGAHGDNVVVSYRTGGGVVSIGHDGGGGGIFQSMVHQGAVREGLINAAALTTTVQHSPCRHEALAIHVPHLQIDIMKIGVGGPGIRRR
jgi:hypothetical protein